MHELDACDPIAFALLTRGAVFLVRGARGEGARFSMGAQEFARVLRDAHLYTLGSVEWAKKVNS